MFNPDGIVLVRKCYITYVNLLFSNSQVHNYIKKGRLLVKVVLYKERVRREQPVSAGLSNTAHVYCGDVM